MIPLTFLILAVIAAAVVGAAALLNRVSPRESCPAKPRRAHHDNHDRLSF